jgi:hypothetical protein
LAAHCRRKEFNGYFFQIREWSDEEIYAEWRTDSFILGYPNLHVGHAISCIIFSLVCCEH